MSQISITAIFCEDVREEKNDINSLIGVLPDNIEFPTIPFVIPKLGIYVRAHIDLDLKSKVTDLVLSLNFPDGTTLPFNTISKATILTEMENVQGGGTYVGIVISGVGVNFAIAAEGLIHVVANFAGKEYFCGRINAKAVSAQDSSTK